MGTEAGGLPHPGRKPRDDEIEVYALTHRGKVREQNEDHFLVCQLSKQMDVLMTSLPNFEAISSGGERLAFLAMVADGVGGGPGGEAASRLAVEAVTRYVSESIHAYYTADPTRNETFTSELAGAALRAHEHLVERSELDPALAKMATTLTLVIGVWPLLYLVQVGDSRYYVLKDGELQQISRDQTVGQELVDSGAIDEAAASRLRWSSTLASSIGGSESRPVVTAMQNAWGNVHLLCSDGLTRHVSDARIQERLATMTSARQACEGLLQDALDGGGMDNITIQVGRTVRKDRD